MVKSEMNNSYEVALNAYRSELERIKELVIKYDSHFNGTLDINEICSSFKDGNITFEKEELILEILKSYERMLSVEEALYQNELNKKYDEEIEKCYKQFITHQDEEKVAIAIDNALKCYETYIPCEVETGIQR